MSKDFDQDRQIANKLIVELILQEIKMYPSLRFGQILRNLGVIVDYIPEGENSPVWSNHFNEEPQNMLKRIYETLNERTY